MNEIDLGKKYLYKIKLIGISITKQIKEIVIFIEKSQYLNKI